MQASDFLDGIDKDGRSIVAEDLVYLLQCADGKSGHPVCLDGHFDLSKVMFRPCSSDVTLLDMQLVRACLPDAGGKSGTHVCSTVCARQTFRPPSRHG